MVADGSLYGGAAEQIGRVHVGSGATSGEMSSGNSVHTRATASQPSAPSRVIISTKRFRAARVNTP